MFVEGDREKKKHGSLLHRLRRRQIFLLEKLGDFEIYAGRETALGTYTLAVPVEQERHWCEDQSEATKQRACPIDAQVLEKLSRKEWEYCSR